VIIVKLLETFFAGWFIPLASLNYARIFTREAQTPMLMKSQADLNDTALVRHGLIMGTGIAALAAAIFT
jgi:hypothetical protein